MKKTQEEKKRNRKGSTGAKLAAWIGITTSAVVFLGGVLGAFVIEDAGVYEMTKEDFRKAAFEGVAGHYAVRALDNMENSDENAWNDTIYRYGIIKAEEIDGLDLNDESIYVVRNFHYDVTPEMLYIQSYNIDENTQFNYSGTLWGGYGVYEQNSGYTTSEPLYATFYNEDDGIFYYEAGGEFFPVRNVSFRQAVDGGTLSYDFCYDYERGMYRNLTADRAAEQEQIAAEEATAAEAQMTTDDERPTAATQPQKAGSSELAAAQEQETGNSELTAAQPMDGNSASAGMAESGEILTWDYVTFDMLADAGWDLEIWAYAVLDNYMLANDGTEIRWTNNEEMNGREISEETDYEIDSSRQFLNINHNEAGDSECYWVVSILPEDVPFGWSRDLFVQANTIITIAYGLRYAIYPILAAVLAIGIFCFVWLIRAAGQRRGTDEIATTWLDRMPFDLYLGFAVVAECFLVLLLDQFNYRRGSIPGYIAMLFLLLCMGWVLLLSILTSAVRVKLGTWWKNTICYRIIRIICNLLKIAAENIGLFGKMILAFGGITIIDLFFLVILWSGTGLFLWMLLKIAEFALLFWGVIQMQRLKEGGERLAEGDMSHRIDEEKMYWEFRNHAENLNSISDGMAKAVDERMKSERFKTELITNVSHDIKTPLTSIINYVDLLEKEELSNETAVGYLEVLDRQSGRLKKLIEDLIEASKASTGNLAVHLEKLEAGVSMVQTIGEFDEKLKANELDLKIVKPEEPVYIMADARHLWRVIDNLMNNICKYAQPGTRVYINLETAGTRAMLTFRNTSRYPLNISSEELMERFVRGDSSRNTEGSGLGISIAKSLMELMGGTFELYVDGDLFKVVIGFDVVFENLPEKEEENITT